jgi:hypothetical protein
MGPSQNVSWDNAVGIATGYGLEDERSELTSLWVYDFSPLHVVQTGSGPHPAPYPVGIRGKAARK